MSISQLSLTLPPAASKTDPWTSHRAAREIDKSGSRRRQIDAVASLVAAHPGCTSAELAATSYAKDRRMDRPMIARRLPDAVAAGLVVKGEARTCEVGGGAALTWWSKR